MAGESGEQVGGELESVTSSAGYFVQGWRGMRQEVDSRDEVMHSEMSDW